MERGHDPNAACGSPAPAETSDRLVGPEHGLGSEGSERHDGPGRDQTDLFLEKWHARGHFVRLRIAVVGRAALQNVGDVDLLALHPHRLDDLGEKLPRAADESQTLNVLFVARGLPHEQEVGGRAALPEHDVGPTARELAPRAAFQKGPQRGKIRDRPRHERGHLAAQGVEKEITHPEVSEELELAADSVVAAHRRVLGAAGPLPEDVKAPLRIWRAGPPEKHPRSSRRPPAWDGATQSLARRASSE